MYVFCSDLLCFRGPVINQLQEDEKPSVASSTEWNTQLRSKPEDVGARERAAVRGAAGRSWRRRPCRGSQSWEPEEGEVRESAETPVRHQWDTRERGAQLHLYSSHRIHWDFKTKTLCCLGCVLMHAKDIWMENFPVQVAHEYFPYYWRWKAFRCFQQGQQKRWARCPARGRYLNTEFLDK